MSDARLRPALHESQIWRNPKNRREAHLEPRAADMLVAIIMGRHWTGRRLVFLRTCSCGLLEFGPEDLDSPWGLTEASGGERPVRHLQAAPLGGPGCCNGILPAR